MTSNTLGEKVTVYLSTENRAWVKSLPGKSDSWKIDWLVTKARESRERDPLEGLLQFLEELERDKDNLYVVAVMDKLGAVTKGKTSLANILRTYLNSVYSQATPPQGGTA
jgi:hypothetical protein